MPTSGQNLSKLLGQALLADLEESDFALLDYVETKSDLRKKLLAQLREGENDAVDEALYKYMRENVNVNDFLLAVDLEGLWRRLEEELSDDDDEDEEEFEEDE